MPASSDSLSGRTTFWEPLVDVRAKKITREAAVAEVARRYEAFVGIFEKGAFVMSTVMSKMAAQACALDSRC